MSRCIEYLPFWFFLGCAACFAQTFTDGPSAAVNADGRIEIFARGSDGAVWHNWQTSPGGAWNGWVSLGGLISGTPIAGVNADGRLDVFARGLDSIAYHNYQTSPGGGWSGWISLGGGNLATSPLPVKNFDGRLQLFALGYDGAVWTACQMIPGDNWSGWTSLGGYVAGSPAVAQNADGRLEMFVRGGGDGNLYHNWQTMPGGAWSGFSMLAGDGNMATAPTVAVNDDGRLEVFEQTTDGAGWHIWQWSPSGSSWSSGETMGGGIVGSPIAALDGGTYLEAFVISPGGAPWVDYQSNAFAGWNSLGGLINAAPATAMNFDGRLEIFGIGTDGTMFHDWQVSPAGPWYGWQPIGVASNTGATNGADMSYFVSDDQDQAYYASMKSQQCPTNMPNLWRGVLNGMIYAWPCGAIVNTAFWGFDNRKPLVEALENWDDKIASWYTQYFNGQSSPNPAVLATYSGGPQAIVADRACDTCISDPQGGYGRGINVGQQRDVSNRLASVEIHIIQGINNGTALKQVFAHELGHTFGLVDCPVNKVDANSNPLYDCSKTVMASELIVAGHGWDETAKNANVTYTPGLRSRFNLLSGPTSCDMSIIDQNLPDYRSCFQIADNTQPTPTCTGGSTLGFADTGGSTATYTCGGAACDGCNPNCSNYQQGFLGTGQCGSGGGGSCPDSGLCDDFRTNVFATDFCRYPSGGCPEGWYQSNYCCYSSTNPPTPIIVDAFGEGFHMTGVSNGVQFRVFSNESPYQMSWTDPRWRNGWLALDRNGNGTIDDFTELFGNDTVQPKSDDPNGYRALALFDDPMNGGNGNGVIDPDDSVYDNLRVWIDANHNGISEPEELHTLRELGIFQIDLRYTNSRYVDANGNQFRYRAKIKDEAGNESRFCYDVLVQIAPEAKN